MDFNDFKLDEKILRAVAKSGYTAPTKIQQEAIPVVLEGKDVRASAQTGTGKTAAFLLPAIHSLAETPRMDRRNAKILILTPTRELAEQITVQAAKYSVGIKNAKSVCVVGGVPYHKQMSKLSRPHDILIATPGRLIDYMNRGKINFADIDMVILDEADRMLDMGFCDAVESILSEIPQDRQTLLFSATMEGEVLNLSKKFMQEPVEIAIHSTRDKHENIEQKLLYVDNLSHKNDLLDHILNAENIYSAIIFSATKRHCDELVGELKHKGFTAAAIHGDMKQRQRTRTIKMLKEGKVNIVVATDVAARGIDVPNISHVINFDLPRDTEDYVHRIGRTGRAGKSGIAISFAGNKDAHMVPRIEKYTGQEIAVIEIKGMEPKNKPNFKNPDGPKSRKNKLRNRPSRAKKFGARKNGGERRDSKRSDRSERDFKKKEFKHSEKPGKKKTAKGKKPAREEFFSKPKNKRQERPSRDRKRSAAAPNSRRSKAAPSQKRRKAVRKGR